MTLSHTPLSLYGDCINTILNEWGYPPISWDEITPKNDEHKKFIEHAIELWDILAAQ